MQESLLKHKIDRFCASYMCVEMEDFYRTLCEMISEGLIFEKGGMVQL